LFECPYYPKWSIDSLQSLLTSNDFLHSARKTNSKIHMEPQKNTEEEKKSWAKKDKVGNSILPFFKIYYKAMRRRLKMEEGRRGECIRRIEGNDEFMMCNMWKCHSDMYN
jgi:hypothetical protein